jgi:predicted Zn-dependent protease
VTAPALASDSQPLLKAIDPSMAQLDAPPPPAAEVKVNPFNSNIQGRPLGQEMPQPMETATADDEARVTRLEQQAFGSAYSEHEAPDRLDHLEKETFGAVKGGPLSERIARLEQKLFGGSAFSSANPSIAANPAAVAAPPANLSQSYPAPTALSSSGPGSAGPGQSSWQQPTANAGAGPGQSGWQQPTASTGGGPGQSSWQQPVSNTGAGPGQSGWQQPVSSTGGGPGQSSWQQPVSNTGAGPGQSGWQQPTANAGAGPGQSGWQQPTAGGYQAPMGQVPAYSQPAWTPSAYKPTNYMPPAPQPAKVNNPVPQGHPQPPAKEAHDRSGKPGANSAPGPSPVPGGAPGAGIRPHPAVTLTADATLVANSLIYDSRVGDYLSAIRRFPGVQGVTYAHWREFPVKIKLPENTPESWQRGLESQVARWNSYIPVKMTLPSENADVEVIWVNQLPAKALGVTRLNIVAGQLKVWIYLLRPSFYPPAIAERTLAPVFTREIGHALGLFGQSERAGDLMSSSAVVGKKEFKLSPVGARDINTLKRLYESPSVPSTLSLDMPMEWATTY